MGTLKTTLTRPLKKNRVVYRTEKLGTNKNLYFKSPVSVYCLGCHLNGIGTRDTVVKLSEQALRKLTQHNSVCSEFQCKLDVIVSDELRAASSVKPSLILCPRMLCIRWVG